MDKDFLLKIYGQCYNAEAGPWNLSVENKYLEYMFAKFFEEHFQVEAHTDICNIGIGAGYWDRYLSYKLKGGTLTSIDRDPVICRQLSEGLRNEHNPNHVVVICSDVMDYAPEVPFDLVTVVGSTRQESGLYETFLERVFSWIKPNGGLYYQTLDPKEDADYFCKLAQVNGLTIKDYLQDSSYGFEAKYWCLMK